MSDATHLPRSEALSDISHLPAINERAYGSGSSGQAKAAHHAVVHARSLAASNGKGDRKGDRKGDILLFH